jgi:diguanylate cyclase (GGDEF)-like protein
VDGFAERREKDGRRVADAVLRAVAAAVAEGVRLVDTVARLGDSEFVVLAPGSGGDTVARRVAAAVDALEPVDGWKPHVSTGVAHVPEDGARLAELIAAAASAIERSRATAG